MTFLTTDETQNRTESSEMPRFDNYMHGGWWLTDWFDGLQTFMRYICHKSWLGGWMMPQKKSYFALHLPKGWWIFGLDLALHGDIDDYQFKFFSELTKQKVSCLFSFVLFSKWNY